MACHPEMAQHNRTWQPERIRGQLLKLGIQVAKSKIQKYIYHLVFAQK
jgi:IS30 family transposase